jgi:hypothetical protein
MGLKYKICETVKVEQVNCLYLAVEKKKLIKLITNVLRIKQRVLLYRKQQHKIPHIISAIGKIKFLGKRRAKYCLVLGM